MAGKPLVSVIIPVYNGSAYLEQAVRSVKEQTYPHLEICAVDDGSTDQSALLLEQIGVDILLRQPNGGTAKARNSGIRHTSGPLITFIDQDDIWVENKVEKQVEFFREDESYMYGIGKQQQFLTPGFSAPGWLKPEWLEGPIPGWLPGTLMVKRQIFDIVGLFDESFRDGSDTDFFFKVKDHGLAFFELDEVVLHRRIHEGNQSGIHKEVGKDLTKMIMASLVRRRKNRKV